MVFMNIGTIATADIFCSDPEIAKKVREDFGAECVENEMDYYTYCHIAAKHAAEFLQDLLWEDID